MQIHLRDHYELKSNENVEMFDIFKIIEDLYNQLEFALTCF
jgi:hypothetical protein